MLYLPAPRYYLAAGSCKANMERHFISIDPGGTTGFAALHVSNHGLTFTLAEYHTQSPDAPGFLALATLLRRAAQKPGTVVIIEDFQLRASPHQGANRNWGLQPVAITGALQGFLAAHHIPTAAWKFQTASLAMSSFPDHRLATVTPVWAQYTTGYPHARDAARHLLTYLKQHEPALFQASKGATPHVGKPLQTRTKHPRRTRAC